MNSLAMSDVVKNIRDLPALPVIVIELMGTLDQEDANTTALANKLSRDQALSAKTLRLANSSFYGMQSKVTTIQQAIAILGFNSVRTLVTTAAIISGFSSNKHVTFNFQGFWRHSIACAIGAKMLARQLNVNQDYAFMAGLLHDIGRLVLVTDSSDHYAEVINYRNEKDCYLLDAEKAVLGIDHTIVGSALAAHWKFPVLMQKAIANHHTPGPDDAGSLAAIIHLSDCIVHALDLSDDAHDLVSPLSASVWEKFNLAQAVLAQIYHDTEIQFEEACKILLAMQG
ncbi:MAG TPA: HDOD domain-containing protein [Burkholderiaceae bacterium]|jgi:putative nucleotidyltransferase with HDIG domain|nr:HDOD domain-containing protein [Burkholderiaceae bacterium]